LYKLIVDASKRASFVVFLVNMFAETDGAAYQRERDKEGY